MPWNGSGVFSPYTPGNPVVTGTSISSAAFNSTISDLAAGLTLAMTKDGQQTPTANLKMGGFKFTGLGQGSALTDSINLQQVQDQSWAWLMTVAGGTAITATAAVPTLATLKAGQAFRFIAAANNTGPATLSINGTTVTPLRKRMSGGAAELAANDMVANLPYSVTYDGIQYMLGEQRPHAQAAAILCTPTINLDSGSAGGATVVSIVGIAGTITVTTATAHGLSTGELVTTSGAAVSGYNVGPVAITVTSATTFTFAGAATGAAGGAPAYTVLAAVSGDYSHIIGSPIASIVGSGTVVTVTTPAAHGLTTGNNVTTSGAAVGGYNVGPVPITVTGSTTFTFAGIITGAAGGTPVYTLTVTAITLTQGEERTVVFDAGVTFTGGGSLILPGTQSTLTTIIGDVVKVRGEAGGVVRFITYSSSIAIPAVSSAQAIRQTVLNGSVDANGVANWLSIGTGLTVNMAATAVPVEMVWANGFSSTGSNDLVANITADAANKFGTLPPFSTPFLYGDYTNGVAFSGAFTLVPPQVSNSFDLTPQTICNFEGTNGQTTTTDDFGKVVTFTGTSTITTAASKFGASCMQGATLGGLNFTTAAQQLLRSGGWTLEYWINFDALPTSVGPTPEMLYISDGGNNPFQIFWLTNTTYRMSTDSSGFVTSSGVTTTIGGWHHFALCNDPLSGNLYSYWDGVSATTPLAITTTPIINRDITLALLNQYFTGSTLGLAAKYDAFEISPYAKYPHGTTFTPPTSAPAVTDQKTCWFDVPNMKMWEVTAPSATGGVKPTLTQRNRLFVGEADTNASGVTAVRNYAYLGRFDNSVNPTTYAANTVYAMNHNLGVPGELVRTIILSRSDPKYPWATSAEQPGGAISRNTYAVSVPTNMPANNNNVGGMTLTTSTTGQIAISARRDF